MRPDPGAAFRALHRKGDPFVLANAWDRGSARMLAALGAPAIATSSAAYGFTLGVPDMGQLSRDQHLAHAEDLVAAVSVPVSGDFENGFGEAPEVCAETVRLAAEAGLAGICIEDTALPDDHAYGFDLAVERIRAAVAAARALPRDFVLVARADGLLTGTYDLAEARRRLIAFAEVGADGIYAPRLPDLAAVEAISAATDCPLNVLIVGEFTAHSRADFAAAGAARLSLGSSLARATQRLLRDAATEMFGEGDFSRLGLSIGAAEVDGLLDRGST